MDDIPRLLELGRQLHQESPRWSRLSFNRDRAQAMLARLIGSTSSVVFVAERAGVVVGGIAGVVEQHWSSDDLVAHEVSLFIEPDARGGYLATKLIVALTEWGRLRGAVWLHAGTSTGLDPERTAGLYEALGFTRCSIGLEVMYGR